MEDKIRDALAYFWNVDRERITGVHVAKQLGSVVTVVYRDPNNQKRSVELDLSAQYMQMFLGDNNEQADKKTTQDETKSPAS